MAKLKLGPITNDKPVKVALSRPGALHRDLVAYAEVLARETGQPAPDPVKLVVPMLERFIATDREFAKSRREAGGPMGLSASPSERAGLYLRALVPDLHPDRQASSAG